MRTSTTLALPLLALLSLAATACGAFGDDDATSTTPELPAREAPPVGGPADMSELTEAFGVFVTPNGTTNAIGTREHPLASIQAGIDLAKQQNKRVYVCSGTFREALVAHDSISIIGGLDCSAIEWRAGAGTTPTRVESPTSPALRATRIESPTRIEGLEIVAPSATAPSASSIGLLAENASKLIIARTHIIAGDGGKGTDGVEGIQLVTSASANGSAMPPALECSDSTCPKGYWSWARPAAPVGGTNTCAGAPGHEAEAGGAGGSGGLWQSASKDATYIWWYYRGDWNYGADNGVSRTSAAGANGVDGANATAIGTFTRDGYVAPKGSEGTNGAAGSGGAGGNGHDPGLARSPVGINETSVWRGLSGAGGGAGGCAGLAGTAGTGGGASIAALLVQSSVTFDDTELSSAHGGKGGMGTFGSKPTAGGLAGASAAAVPSGAGRNGGHGGTAGFSGNGASGPSIGIAHIGAPPIVWGGSKIRAGSGGAAIDARSRPDGFGGSKTIPATPAGVSKDVLAL